jgi:hypothetical protein
MRRAPATWLVALCGLLVLLALSPSARGAAPADMPQWQTAAGDVADPCCPLGRDRADDGQCGLGASCPHCMVGIDTVLATPLRYEPGAGRMAAIDGGENWPPDAPPPKPTAHI